MAYKSIIIKAKKLVMLHTADEFFVLNFLLEFISVDEMFGPMLICMNVIHFINRQAKSEFI
jgi:hypothetical protein